MCQLCRQRPSAGGSGRSNPGASLGPTPWAPCVAASQCQRSPGQSRGQLSHTREQSAVDRGKSTLAVAAACVGTGSEAVARAWATGPWRPHE